MNDSMPPAMSGLIQRAKDILMKPAQTWPTIAAEPSSPGELITKYAVPLAAIGPVAGFLRGQLFGYGAFGFSYRPGILGGISTLIVGYVLGLIGVIVLALITDFLAPKFDGTANRTNAFKLVVFSSFAAWLAGIFQLVPGLGLLGLAGLYTLYLFYTGAAPLMKVPQEKAIGYTAVTIVCAVVMYMVVGAVTASVVGLFGLGAPSLAANDSSASVTIPGVGTINGGKMEEASKQLEAATNGQVTPVDTEKLKGLLPAALGSYTRTSFDSGAMGGMGKGVSATYTSGDKSIKLSVVDSAGLGALAGMAGAMGVEQSHEDADSYEKTGTVGGQFQTEKWNRKDNRGEFGQQIGGRFFVSAEGEAGSIDELKAAVAAVDPGQLAALAK